MESYKNKSKIATIIAFLAGFIAYIGKDGLAQIIPEEYAAIIPVIVFIAGYILTQSTENKRVVVAEQLVRDEYEDDYAPTDDGIVGVDDDI